jgi:pyruvate kinase
MRRTKIVCTLGPAVDNAQVLTKICAAGMNVARFNFSHGDYAEQQKRIDLFKSIRDELNLPIATMLDTKGPEIRIGAFKNNEIFLEDGAFFTLCNKECLGDQERVYANYPTLYSEISVGSTILINDGLIELCVEEIIG